MGINQLRLNPAGTTSGDGTHADQTCDLVPNSAPAISKHFRKSAQTVSPLCCSFQLDSRPRFPRAGLAAVHSTGLSNQVSAIIST
jgi:hypothetical protein